MLILWSIILVQFLQYFQQGQTETSSIAIPPVVLVSSERFPSISMLNIPWGSSRNKRDHLNGWFGTLCGTVYDLTVLLFRIWNES